MFNHMTFKVTPGKIQFLPALCASTCTNLVYLSFNYYLLRSLTLAAVSSKLETLVLSFQISQIFRNISPLKARTKH